MERGAQKGQASCSVGEPMPSRIPADDSSEKSRVRFEHGSQQR